MRVLVAGDFVTDHYVYEGQDHLAGSTIVEGARWIAEPGGAGLLGRLIQASATAVDATRTSPISVDVAADALAPTRAGYGVMQSCQRQRGDSRRVWRMGRSLGFSSATRGVDASPGPEAAALDTFADIVVLDDAALGFRRWPSRHRWPRFLRECERDLPRWIVLKMSGPIAAGDLWHTLVSGREQRHDPAGSSPRAEFGRLADRTILVVSIDELRREHVRVDGKLSWESAAADLIEGLETSPRLQTLKAVRGLVIRFGLDGALLVERSEGHEPRRTLIFDPAGSEGAFLARVPEGRVFGYQSCLTAAIVRQLMQPDVDETSWAGRVGRGVADGLNAGRRLVIDGHEPDAAEGTSFPLGRVVSEFHATSPEWQFASTALPPGLVRTSRWTMIGGASTEARGPLWGLARRVALHGVAQLTGVPYAQFARLFSVDRSEIESLRSLERLLTNYMHDAKASKPLSLAAFGPPGSGKSFGIKQLAEALFGDRSPLEFNLSQFTTPGELHALFHQVRDRVLQGRVPLVFWDEFDSRDLYWLQYLLAPMQDGTFQDGQITHPIGKCVFVFAGGTRQTFEDFGHPPPRLGDLADPAADQRWRDEFAMKKGPDFKSRLAGYINVLGPNRRDAQDITFPVRRALLLRVHLGLGAAQPAHIDAGLLDAFLRIGAYRHGSRSLEKIAEQVRLSSATGAYTRSDLPPRQQLDLHVIADEFLNLVESA